MGHRGAAWLGMLLAGVLVVGVLAACGDDGDDEASTTTEASSTTPSTEASTTTTTEEAVDVSSGDLPPTQAFALDRYGVDYPGEGAFDEARFGVPPGSVSAAWYRVGRVWAMHFQGLSPEQANGKCLGTMTEATFTPRPYGPGACGDLPAEFSLPPGSLRLCGNKAIILTTELSFQGPLLGVGAQIQQLLDDGTSHQSMYGIPSHPIGAVPAIDVSNCETIS